MFVGLALIGAISLLSAEMGACTGWRSRLSEGLIALRDKYPEISAFDPSSAIEQHARGSSLVIEYGRDVELRQDLPNPFPRVVLRGAGAIWFKILFKPTVEIVEGNTGPAVGWFDGQICESSYRVTVRAADADREAAIACCPIDCRRRSRGLPLIEIQ